MLLVQHAGTYFEVRKIFIYFSLYYLCKAKLCECVWEREIEKFVIFFHNWNIVLFIFFLKHSVCLISLSVLYLFNIMSLLIIIVSFSIALFLFCVLLLLLSVVSVQLFYKILFCFYIFFLWLYRMYNINTMCHIL